MTIQHRNLRRDPSSRNAGIDMLRGVAIVLVVLHHIGLRIPLHKTSLADVFPARLLSALNYNGYEAVFVFFVISGFLITLHVLKRHGSPAAIDARAFYVRRASRILPSLALLVAVLAVMHLAGIPNYVIDKPGQSLGGAVLSAFGLYLNWYEGMTDWLPGGWDVLWSLSIEEVFYFAFPLVCLVVRSRALLIVLLALFALSLPITRAALEGNEIWQEKAYLPGMAAIATGVLAAFAAQRCRPTARETDGLCVLGIVGLLAEFGYGGVLWPLFGNGSMLVLTFSAAALVIGLHARAAGGRSTTLRGFGWLRSFGRLSYEVYLTHMFVVFAVVGLFRASGGDMRAAAWWYLSGIASCWLLGMLFARWYSVPCERVLRRRWLHVDATNRR